MKVITGAVVSLILFAPYAEAVVVCQKGTKVKLRPAFCKGTEVQVQDLSTSGSADAQTLQGLTAQQLIDRAASQVGDAQTLQGLTAQQLVSQAVAQSRDAQTVQGFTVNEIVSAAVSEANLGTGVALATLVTSGYRVFNSQGISTGFCGCAQRSCNDSSDLLITCGGNAQFVSTGLRVTGLTSTLFGACQVCACNDSVLTETLQVSATCLALP